MNQLHEKFMRQRYDLFVDLIDISTGDLIVDLGGGTGEFMELFADNEKDCEISIADISQEALQVARGKGFETILLEESAPLPFKDKEVDVIFCNSVIEHCTIPKSSIWDVTNDKQFRDEAFRAQSFFASEIERVSKKYFVQTPSKSFPVESHTVFPFIARLRRPYQIAAIKVLNKVWVTKTSPDWNLLDKDEMQHLFRNGSVLENRWLGFSKELIAYRN